MFRKTILSTVAAAILATSAVSVSTTTASARDRDRDRAVIGAVIGLVGAIAGVKAERPRGHGYPRGGHHIDRHDDAECFERPIKRYSRRHGHRIIVGYKTICR
ncbi:hypothetical protein [Jiella marina]|uniref:hypothetical protein n=1 Tax=Jiella sp. LLJ827 TaxID=2917712 RepID=UPI002101395A|nr:hypothetical protein [Jiella sp. LLJ827]MCQ0986759.1 hypothetical protein [Jiella sp. LLJ827]